jgi:hypothetical protein
VRYKAQDLTSIEACYLSFWVRFSGLSPQVVAFSPHRPLLYSPASKVRHLFDRHLCDSRAD